MQSMYYVGLDVHKKTITPTDPLTFTAVALLTASATVMASYLPARRAMHVDPMVALRYE